MAWREGAWGTGGRSPGRAGVWGVEGAWGPTGWGCRAARTRSVLPRSLPRALTARAAAATLRRFATAAEAQLRMRFPAESTSSPRAGRRAAESAESAGPVPAGRSRRICRDAGDPEEAWGRVAASAPAPGGGVALVGGTLDGRGRQGEERSTLRSPARVAVSVGRSPVPWWPLVHPAHVRWAASGATCEGLREAPVQPRLPWGASGSRHGLGTARFGARCEPQALLRAGGEAEAPLPSQGREGSAGGTCTMAKTDRKDRAGAPAWLGRGARNSRCGRGRGLGRWAGARLRLPLAGRGRPGGSRLCPVSLCPSPARAGAQIRPLKRKGGRLGVRFGNSRPACRRRARERGAGSRGCGTAGLRASARPPLDPSLPLHSLQQRLDLDLPGY